MKPDRRYPDGIVRRWFRRQVGWLVIVCYVAIVIWSARSLWHVLRVPLFLVTVIGGVFLLVIIFAGLKENKE